MEIARGHYLGAHVGGTVVGGSLDAAVARAPRLL